LIRLRQGYGATRELRRRNQSGAGEQGEEMTNDEDGGKSALKTKRLAARTVSIRQALRFMSLVTSDQANSTS